MEFMLWCKMICYLWEKQSKQLSVKVNFLLLEGLEIEVWKILFFLYLLYTLVCISFTFSSPVSYNSFSTQIHPWRRALLLLGNFMSGEGISFSWNLLFLLASEEETKPNERRKDRKEIWQGKLFFPLGIAVGHCSSRLFSPSVISVFFFNIYFLQVL